MGTAGLLARKLSSFKSNKVFVFFYHKHTEYEFCTTELVDNTERRRASKIDCKKDKRKQMRLN